MDLFRKDLQISALAPIIWLWLERGELMKNTQAGRIALGGILAALAVVIMSLGGLIPVATYTCPVLCALLLEIVRRVCGTRTGWAWYGAVSILALLLGPDKEAAAVFAFLGYYPLIKRRLDELPGKWFWKALFFNAVAVCMYWLLIHLFGLNQLDAEFAEIGRLGGFILLALGNVLFFLLDRILEHSFQRRT